MAHFDNQKPILEGKAKRFRFAFHIPQELREEFADRMARENAIRIVYAFIVGAVTHVGSTWIDWQRMQEGLFEERPGYRWIFYNHLLWWLMAWVPIVFAMNWSRIRSGLYPAERLRRWGTVAIVWAWALPLHIALLSFKYNHALGYYTIVMIIIALFIFTLRFRFWLLLISAVAMCAVVVSQPDLTKLEIRFWLIAIINTSILTLMLSNVWYNNMARQFLNGKMLEVQKYQLAAQAALLTEQNQVIETDKALLAQQLDSSQRQLNAFALRLAKSGNLLESIKADLADIKVTEAEEASKQKQLLRKIANANTRESDWALFREQFEQVYPDFIPTLLKQFPSLNSGELRLLSLLKMNLETQEIASIIGISVQSLHTARYRLRKHLGLNTDEGLFEFVQRYQ